MKYKILNTEITREICPELINKIGLYMHESSRYMPGLGHFKYIHIKIDNQTLAFLPEELEEIAII